MLTLMSKKVRMIFDTSDAMRRAINIRAAKHGKTVSDVINKALEQFITDQELREAEKLIEQSPEQTAPTDAEQKPGKKPRR